MTLHAILWVASGGALGAVGRFAIGESMKVSNGFPWGTLSVNLLGALMMGLLIGWLSRQAAPLDGVRLFLAVGVLGGFTTFSAFSMDIFVLLEKRELLALSGYVGGSLLGGVVLFAAGYMLVRVG